MPHSAIPKLPGRRCAARFALVAALPLVAACASGAPGTASPSGPAPAAPAIGESAASADARFVRDMIAHHEQALTMAALVPARTPRADLGTLAERITASQQEEIARMRRWQAAHAAASAAPGHHAGHGGMPGMLSAQDLARLEAAEGPEFERLFLELMIRHHEGALTMAAQLLNAPGAREPELFRLVNDIDADQRAEIARMRGLLAAGQ